VTKVAAKELVMSDRLQHVQQRNLDTILALGIGGVASAPALAYFAPLGVLLGPVAAALGMMMVVQGVRLRARMLPN
jgi:hypothetical protein